MVKARFEYEGNNGLLSVNTHFDRSVEIACTKSSDEIFRLGGTAVSDVATYEGVILSLAQENSLFRAFRTEDKYFEDMGLLSSEVWTEADLHCFVTEYYPLNMEGQRPGWLISKKPIIDANHLFINLDVLDGGNNVIKRYRVSPFTGDHIIMGSL